MKISLYLIICTFTLSLFSPAWGNVKKYPYYMIEGKFPEKHKSRPYMMWIQNEEGKISGWKESGSKPAEQVPHSSCDLNPLLASDPDADDSKMIPDSVWPYTISLNQTPLADLKIDFTIYIKGLEDANYTIELHQNCKGSFKNEIKKFSGKVIKGETKKISSIVSEYCN